MGRAREEACVCVCGGGGWNAVVVAARRLRLWWLECGGGGCEAVVVAEAVVVGWQLTLCRTP